jgi:hypothetical protein
MTDNPHDPHRNLDPELVNLVLAQLEKELGPPSRGNRYDNTRMVHWHRGNMLLNVYDEDGSRYLGSWGFDMPVGGFQCGFHKEAAREGNFKLWQFLQDRGVPAKKPPTNGIHIWEDERTDFRLYPIQKRWHEESEVIFDEILERASMHDWSGMTLALFELENEVRIATSRTDEVYSDLGLNQDPPGMKWPGHVLNQAAAFRERIEWELANPGRYSIEGLSKPNLRGLWMVANGYHLSYTVHGFEDAPVNADFLSTINYQRTGMHLPSPHIVEAVRLIPVETLYGEPVPYSVWSKARPDSEVLAAGYLQRRIDQHETKKTPWDKDLVAKYRQMLSELSARPKPVGPPIQHSLFEE